MNKIILCFLGVSFFFFPFTTACDDDFQHERIEMIQQIQQDAYYARRTLGRDHFDKRVLNAMEKVPRHEFVPSSLKAVAYLNQPLPIGHGQTISQPYIVALMTDLMKLERENRVLEVGTGSGYQAAVLAELVTEVFTIEIIEELADSARERLKHLGYGSVKVKTGDGYFGWKEKAPFDSIIVTAASGHVPPPLVAQLKPGGRIIIPVGSIYQVQMLTIVSKDNKGAITTEQVMPVLFVPLTGRQGPE